MEYYTTGFYERIGTGATRSAEAVLPLVFDLVPVRSVVDVGCGEGNWLAVCQKLGITDVVGIDGEYVHRERLRIPQSRFLPFDLTKPLRIGRTFSLAISMEVAEHLPSDCAADFVESLTRLAPVILFSAAIPFQGGDHHVNEQWPDEWAALFREHGYLAIDAIRKRIWDNDAVEHWYAQNALLFARQEFIQRSPALQVELESTNPAQLCLVHPKQYLYLHNLYLEASVPDEPVACGVRGASMLLLPWIRSLRIRLWYGLLTFTRPIRYRLGLRRRTSRTAVCELEPPGAYREWAGRHFAVPSPDFIKQKVVLRNGLEDATWIETGTYLGDTTDALSRIAKIVYTIEPEPKLFLKAKQRFSNAKNVKVINGLSEDVLPKLLRTIKGDVCFWLDGHYSVGITFKGPQDTPIIDELTAVGENLAGMGKVVVMVDDVRCFDPKNPHYTDYPPVDFLVDWARKHNLRWCIEHDIFVATKS